MTMLWALSLSDGEHSLLDIAARAERPFEQVAEVARVLDEHVILVADEAAPAPSKSSFLPSTA